MELLQEVDFDMKYVIDKENVFGFVLSRRPLANAISCIINSLIDRIQIYYAEDDIFKNPFESLAKEARIVDEIDKFKSFVLNGVLYYNARLNIMNDFHNILISDHLEDLCGNQVSLLWAKEDFF